MRHVKRLLKFAVDYPNEWHGFGTDRTTRAALSTLNAWGVLDVSYETKQFRLKPAKHERPAVASEN